MNTRLTYGVSDGVAEIQRSAYELHTAQLMLQQLEAPGAEGSNYARDWRDSQVPAEVLCQPPISQPARASCRTRLCIQLICEIRWQPVSSLMSRAFGWQNNNQLGSVVGAVPRDHHIIRPCVGQMRNVDCKRRRTDKYPTNQFGAYLLALL